MATLTPVSPARAATTLPASAASSGGDDWVNNGRDLLLIEHTNGAGADVTLTIETTAEVDGEAVADKTVTVTKGTRQILGPFPIATYNDGSNKVNLTYSSETDIEVAVIRPPA